ncbi:unnamed protein product [Larinioides sclopetarius]|uniref:Uncharacterized protein n=1 Tax=Larinioides sclopetarius TaxID=280406 RepID=A0AAV1ZFY0_9ARAC
MASLEEENKLLEESLAELDGAVRDNDVESVAKITSITLPLKRRHYFLENEETDSEEGESSDEDDDGSSPSPPIATSSPRRKTKRI